MGHDRENAPCTGEVGTCHPRIQTIARTWDLQGQLDCKAASPDFYEMKLGEALDVSPWGKDACSREPLDGLGLLEPLAQSLQGGRWSWLRIRKTSEDFGGCHSPCHRQCKLSEDKTQSTEVSRPASARPTRLVAQPRSARTAKLLSDHNKLALRELLTNPLSLVDAALRSSFRFSAGTTFHILRPRI